MGLFFMTGVYDNFLEKLFECFLEGNRQFVSCGYSIERNGSELRGWVKDTLTEQMYKLTLATKNRENFNDKEMGIMPAISTDRKEVARGTKKDKKKGKGRDIKRSRGNVE